jgi:hypothetical protein
VSRFMARHPLRADVDRGESVKACAYRPLSLAMAAAKEF